MGVKKLEIANNIRRKKAFKSKWRIYKFIDRNPGITIYDLTKKINWSAGKITYYIQKLLKDGLIKNSTEISNGRAHKHFFSKTVKELINWDEMTNI